jgi:RNA polymerase sigma factor for flagellar operon FliA
MPATTSEKIRSAQSEARNELHAEPAFPTPHSTSLWQRYREGSDAQSENDLVEQYIPLVKTIVGRLAMTLPSHVDFEELQSVGVVGLLHAIRNFDPKNGASFETYARFRIRGAVVDELRKMDWASRTVREKARKIQTAIMELEQRHPENVPTDVQVAAQLGISLEEYQRWLDEVRPTTFVCLDAASHEDDASDWRSPSETISDPTQETPMETAARRETAALIADRIKKLPELQRKVLALYYYEGLRLREIAEAYGVTESRICQVHAQAILSIRSYLSKAERGSEALRLFQ